MRDLSALEERVRASRGTDADQVVVSEPGDRVVDGASWGPDRQVRASVLVEMLTTDATGRRALALAGARIVGDLDLTRLTVPVPLVLRRCFLDGDLSLGGATTDRIDLDGSFLVGQVVGTGMRSSDSLLLTNVVCQGGVWMPGAEIRGTLSLSGSILGAHSHGSVLATHLVAREVLVARARCAGRVDLRNARVSGAVSLDGSVVHGTHDIALHAQGLTATSLSCQGDAASGREFVAIGGVRILDARIEGGTVNFAGASLTATTDGRPDARGTALLAGRLRCAASVILRNGFTTVGSLDLGAAQVGGQIDLGAAHLRGSPYALVGDGATIGQDLLLNRGFRTEGTVKLTGATVRGELTLRSADLSTTTDRPAVVLDSVHAGRIFLDWARVPTGAVDLTGVTTETLVDDQRTWPGAGDVMLGDLTYRSLSAAGTAEDRLTWLARDRYGYSPHAYDVLAAAYRRVGDDEAARDVLIGKQRARREHPGLSHAAGRWWSTFLRWTVGYGYAPARIVPWFLGLLLVGWGLFAGPAESSMRATGEAAEAQGFHPFLYVLDLLLPVASLGVRSGWTPTGLGQWLVVAWTLAGWLLGLTLVAAIGGALKRD